MHGGVQAVRGFGDKFPSATTAGLPRGRVPHLDGGVVLLHGIGRGGVVITSSTGSLCSFSAATVAVVSVVLVAVVLVRDMVTIVVVVGFLICCLGAMFFSNNARRCATVKAVLTKLGQCGINSLSGERCGG